MRFSLRGRKARCCQKPGSWERQAPLPGLVCMALCFRRGSSQVWKSWFDESFGTKFALDEFDSLFSLRGWARVQSTAGFCAAFGRRRARKVRKRKTTVDRDRSQLSIKKRTTKKGGDGEEQISLAWVCSSEEYMTQGVIIHGHMVCRESIQAA